MASLADVYRALNTMVADGVVENYAIGGGMAALFFAETTLTYDVDVFAVIPQTGLLVSLTSVYAWARERGYDVHHEHILMHGVPVQILSASPGLDVEAVETAVEKRYEEVPVRVMAPEYLIALYLRTGGQTRQGRAQDLFRSDFVNEPKLLDILERYKLTDKWRQLKGT